jgi:hypothetical protein
MPYGGKQVLPLPTMEYHWDPMFCREAHRFSHHCRTLLSAVQVVVSSGFYAASPRETEIAGLFDQLNKLRFLEHMFQNHGGVMLLSQMYGARTRFENSCTSLFNRCTGAPYNDPTVGDLYLNYHLSGAAHMEVPCDCEVYQA